MSGLFQDLRYTVRQLRNQPAFTAVAVLTLSLGIGASTAVFTILDAVLLRPLPYQDSSHLVAIWNSELRNPGTKIFAPYRDFEEFQSRSHTVDAAGGGNLGPRRRNSHLARLSPPGPGDSGHG